MTKTEMQAEALARAEQGESFVNYPAIYSGFAAKGIAESEIQPRVNVLTFQAWKAKGRVVRRGEHGVKVITWIPVTDKQTGEITGKRPWTSTVFHISQTAELGQSYSRAREYVRDPGEDAADRWNETHGDRWIEA